MAERHGGIHFAKCRCIVPVRTGIPVSDVEFLAHQPTCVKNTSVMAPDVGDEGTLLNVAPDVSWGREIKMPQFSDNGWFWHLFMDGHDKESQGIVLLFYREVSLIYLYLLWSQP